MTAASGNRPLRCAPPAWWLVGLRSPRPGICLDHRHAQLRDAERDPGRPARHRPHHGVQPQHWHAHDDQRHRQAQGAHHRHPTRRSRHRTSILERRLTPDLRLARGAPHWPSWASLTSKPAGSPPRSAGRSPSTSASVPATPTTSALAALSPRAAQHQVKRPGRRGQAYGIQVPTHGRSTNSRHDSAASSNWLAKLSEPPSSGHASCISVAEACRDSWWSRLRSPDLRPRWRQFERRPYRTGWQRDLRPPPLEIRNPSRSATYDLQMMARRLLDRLAKSGHRGLAKRRAAWLLGPTA